MQRNRTRLAGIELPVGAEHFAQALDIGGVVVNVWGNADGTSTNTDVYLLFGELLSQPFGDTVFSPQAKVVRSP